MDKATLRKTYLEKRLTLSIKEYDKRNKKLIENLFQLVDFTKIEYLHVFLPIEKFKEVNTWPIIARVKKNYPHIKIVVPKVVGDKLVHYLFETKDQLKISKWGIEEPSYGTIISPQQIDMVHVPLVVADKKGNRIGYGKGFYDRFLSECKPTAQKIGLSLLPLLDKIDCVESTDVKLDTCITP